MLCWLWLVLLVTHGCYNVATAQENVTLPAPLPVVVTTRQSCVNVSDLYGITCSVYNLPPVLTYTIDLRRTVKSQGGRPGSTINVLYAWCTPPHGLRVSDVDWLSHGPFYFDETQCTIPDLRSRRPPTVLNVTFQIAWGNRTSQWLPLLNSMRCGLSYTDVTYEPKALDSDKSEGDAKFCGAPHVVINPAPASAVLAENETYVASCDCRPLLAHGYAVQAVIWNVSGPVTEVPNAEKALAGSAFVDQSALLYGCNGTAVFVANANAQMSTVVSLSCSVGIVQQGQTEPHYMQSKVHSYMIRGSPTVELTAGTWSASTRSFKAVCKIPYTPLVHLLIVNWYVFGEKTQHVQLKDLQNSLEVEPKAAQSDSGNGLPWTFELDVLAESTAQRVQCERAIGALPVPALRSTVLTLSPPGLATQSAQSAISGASSARKLAKDVTHTVTRRGIKGSSEIEQEPASGSSIVQVLAISSVFIFICCLLLAFIVARTRRKRRFGHEKLEGATATQSTVASKPRTRAATASVPATTLPTSSITSRRRARVAGLTPGEANYLATIAESNLVTKDQTTKKPREIKFGNDAPSLPSHAGDRRSKKADADSELATSNSPTSVVTHETNASTSATRLTIREY